MRLLKIAAVALTLGVTGMSPQPTCAAASSCGACYAGCTAVWMNDTSPGRDWAYSHCLNGGLDDNGNVCQRDI